MTDKMKEIRYLLENDCIWFSSVKVKFLLAEIDRLKASEKGHIQAWELEQKAKIEAEDERDRLKAENAELRRRLNE